MYVASSSEFLQRQTGVGKLQQPSNLVRHTEYGQYFSPTQNEKWTEVMVLTDGKQCCSAGVSK